MSDHGNVQPIKTYAPPLSYLHNIQKTNKPSEEEFNEKVYESTGLVIVDCFATWCGPCRAIAPRVAELSKTYSSAKFYQIDVDELNNLAANLGVRAMPTFILFKDGKRLDQSDVVGANPAGLDNAIKANIA